jgi:hypothetical protein
MNILQQPDRDIILYGADDKHFGTDREKFLKNLELSEHYNRGTDKNRTKEVINLKDMADQITAKLSPKEIFFLNFFTQSKQSSIR